MKTKVMTFLMLLMVLPVKADATTASNGPASYIIGGIIALLILGYLIYTLIRPEKF
jgi:K+-transporting ATPase KdpF subunit